MKKSLILLSMFAFILGGCESKTLADNNTNIVLTEQDVKDAENNSNIGAQILVRKAVLKEMQNEKYTEEEKKELEDIKENVEIEYFLNKKAMATTNIDDMEVLQVYQNNADKFTNADITVILPQIKEQMLIQKREEEKIKYMNSLVEKYKLNDELKKHFPEIDKKESEEKKEISKEETK